MGAVSAVVFIRAFTVTLAGDSATFALALIEIRFSINAAFWYVELGAVLAVGLVKVTNTIMQFPDALALEEALVIVVDAIGAAYGNVGEGFRAATI